MLDRMRGAARRAFPAAALVGFILWFGWSQGTNLKWIDLGTEAMYLAAAAIGVNILLGYTGLLSLGHAGFIVAGGYAGAIFTPYMLGGSFLPAFVTVNAPWFGIIVAFVFGALLGALLALMCCHLRGFYLTVVTLGFGVFLPAVTEVMKGQLGGPAGRSLDQFVDTRNAFLARDNARAGLFYVSALFLLVVLLVTRNLVCSRWGRAYMAIRESELAAKASGVATYRYKVSAFALSAGIVAVAGWVAAQRFLSVAPADVTNSSFRLVIMVVIGGVGTLAGPVIGAFAVTFAFAFAWVQDTFRNYLGLLFGALGLVTVALAPEGAVGSARKLAQKVARRRARRNRTSRNTPVVDVDAVRPEPRRRDRDSAPDVVLEVAGVAKSFGGVNALAGIDLVIERGTVHALIGPNGSGKSTFVNTVSGVYRPTRGTIRFNGEEIDRLSMQARSRAGIARTFQNLQVWRRMSVLENVMVGAHARGHVGLSRSLMGTRGSRRVERDLETRAWGMLAFVGLASKGHDLAGSLPFPDQRRLEVARALAHDPELLLLDEPAAGMQASDIDALVALVGEVRDAGVTVLLVEHHVQLVMGLSDRVTVLDYGLKIAEGSPAEVRADPDVIAAYLGTEAA